ncbi:MAG: hypothetical protein K0M40_05990 [Prolixibacteraceae bacterium]|nr:hypothetical protein [Prolixibacteraceae bacterium]
MFANSKSTNATRWTGAKRKMRKFFLGIILLIVIISGPFIYVKYFYTYSEGYRAGLLQKFSKKGNLFKTYEGEMILSSVVGNQNVAIASEKFFFSVTDEKVANHLDTIQGQMVIVHYNQKNGALFWNGESEYIVDSVKPIP